MKVIGLTGSIGMGKSTAARQLRGMGYPVYDADKVVHRLLARGGKAVPMVRAAFPDAVVNGAVNRERLGQLVHGAPEALRQLEGILHPLVLAARDEWLQQQRACGAGTVFLDIPLLFEVGWDEVCDAVVVVTTGEHIQRQRVLARPGMTERRLADILARQLPDADKRRRADALVETGHGLARSREDLRRALELIHSASFVKRRRDGKA